MSGRFNIRIVLFAAVVAFLAGSALAQAARADTFRDRFELRFGVGLHGVGSVERDAVALNPELVLPSLRLFDLPVGPTWSFLIPRLHAGAMLNMSGRTNYVYFGGLWTFELVRGLFLEGFLGGAVHDGSLLGDIPGRQAALGCRLLFHSGGSLGYRLTPRWNVMVTFDHVSNGNAAFGACPRNQGLNNYLIRAGYSF